MLVIFRGLLRLLKIPQFKFHLNLNMMIKQRQVKANLGCDREGRGSWCEAGVEECEVVGNLILSHTDLA